MGKQIMYYFLFIACIVSMIVSSSMMKSVEDNIYISKDDKVDTRGKNSIKYSVYLGWIAAGVLAFLMISVLIISVFTPFFVRYERIALITALALSLFGLILLTIFNFGAYNEVKKIRDNISDEKYIDICHNASMLTLITSIFGVVVYICVYFFFKEDEFNTYRPKTRLPRKSLRGQRSIMPDSRPRNDNIDPDRYYQYTNTHIPNYSESEEDMEEMRTMIPSQRSLSSVETQPMPRQSAIKNNPLKPRRDSQSRSARKSVSVNNPLKPRRDSQLIPYTESDCIGEECSKIGRVHSSLLYPTNL